MCVTRMNAWLLGDIKLTLCEHCCYEVNLCSIPSTVQLCLEGHCSRAVAWNIVECSFVRSRFVDGYHIHWKVTGRFYSLSAVLWEMRVA